MATPPPRDFVVQAATHRVVFRRGCVTGSDTTAAATSASVAEAEIRALGCQRLLLVGSPRALGTVGGLVGRLGELVVGTVEELGDAQAAFERMASVEADGLVSVGGGTSIGVAKALAAMAADEGSWAVPIVCIPTTYSGSEVTAYWGKREAQADGGTRKVARRNESVRPRLVLYDPALLDALPLHLSVVSLFNALAHAFEVTWLPRVAPQSRWAALEAIRAILRWLPRLRHGYNAGTGIVDELLYGAYLAAYALDAEDLGLQHRLAHVLGGRFRIPHAEAHTAILPHVIYHNRAALPAELGEALGLGLAAGGGEGEGEGGCEGVAALVYDAQCAMLPAPPSLASLGFSEEKDVDAAIDALLAVGGVAGQHPPLPPLDRPGLRALLERATRGQRPPAPEAVWEGGGGGGRGSAQGHPNPRVPYLADAEFVARDAGTAGEVMERRRGRLLNLDRALMHSPAVLRAWNGMFGCLRSGLQLDGRLRELVILRVAVVNRAYYEWFQHYDVFLAEGGTGPEAQALGDWASPEASALLSARDRAVLAYVDAMTTRVQVPAAVADAALCALGGSARELVELTALCGGYNLVSRFLEALKLAPERATDLPPMPRDARARER